GKGKYDGGFVDTAYQFKIQAGSPDRIQLIITSDGSTNEGISDGGTPALDRWNHVAFTYNGSYLTTYINGSATATSAFSSDIYQSSKSSIIGAFYGSSSLADRFDGEIDEVKIYNRSLSSDEIKQEYFNTTPDNEYEGNYPSQVVDENTNMSWNTLNVNASIPDDTDVDLIFRALDQGGASFSNTVSTQSDFNLGGFSGGSADRNDNSGVLGVGYLNGSNPSGSGLVSGLVGFWRLDGVSGSVVDYSGNNNDGSYVGDGRGVQGVFGTGGFGFDYGSRDNLTVSVDSSLDFEGEVTVSAWVNLGDEPDGSTNYQHKVVYGDNDGYNSDTYDLRRGPNDWEWEVNGSVTECADGVCDAPAVGSWQHVVGVANGTHIVLYVNGVMRNATGFSSGIGEEGLAIGSQGGDNKHFNGSIDEVRVYDRGLSQQEIKQLYFEGKDGVFDGKYRSRTDNSNIQSWNTLNIDAVMPGGSDNENIIDGFEDNDLSEYSGSTGSYNLVTDTVYKGS
ncbi:MAG: hypothetical protein BRC26_01410, partial [Nanohaloarchaea archaeon QH_8_44_6]